MHRKLIEQMQDIIGYYVFLDGRQRTVHDDLMRTLPTLTFDQKIELSRLFSRSLDSAGRAILEFHKVMLALAAQKSSPGSTPGSQRASRGPLRKRH